MKSFKRSNYIRVALCVCVAFQRRRVKKTASLTFRPEIIVAVDFKLVVVVVGVGDIDDFGAEASLEGRVYFGNDLDVVHNLGPMLLNFLRTYVTRGNTKGGSITVPLTSHFD